MKPPLLIGLLGEATILATGSMPTLDEIQAVAQILLQVVIGIVTVYKILTDKKK